MDRRRGIDSEANARAFIELLAQDRFPTFIRAERPDGSVYNH